jgi:regulator of extracellular matrix RemA (YlzA/DUF370 family)
MSDLMQITFGSRPWLPGPGVKPVAVFHKYDVPLIGIVKQHNVPHLFRCLIGEIEPVSFWGYSTLTEAEAKQLTKASGAEFERLIDAAFVDRTVMVALADEETGVLMAVQVEAKAAISDLVRDANESLKRLVQDAAKGAAHAEIAAFN